MKGCICLFTKCLIHPFNSKSKIFFGWKIIWDILLTATPVQDHICRSRGAVQVGKDVRHLANTSSSSQPGCSGYRARPLTLEAQAGQTINLTLVDYATQTSGSLSRRQASHGKTSNYKTVLCSSCRRRLGNTDLYNVEKEYDTTFTDEHFNPLFNIHVGLLIIYDYFFIYLSKPLKSLFYRIYIFYVYV